MVLVKHFPWLQISSSFLFGQIGLEKVFSAVLDRKQTIQDYKNINLRSQKSDISVHGFGQKFVNL